MRFPKTWACGSTRGPVRSRTATKPTAPTCLSRARSWTCAWRRSRYTSDAAPDVIAEFYRRELAAYGPVTLCRGDLDFDGPTHSSRRAASAAVRQGQLQVGVGNKGNFRLASVKPRGSGSEFAVVYVRASNDL